MRHTQLAGCQFEMPGLFYSTCSTTHLRAPDRRMNGKLEVTYEDGHGVGLVVILTFEWGDSGKL